MTVAFTIPGLKLPSVANLREHWATKAKRTEAQRRAVKLHWLAVARPGRDETVASLEHPLVVTLTRSGPGRLDDDNLASAFKAVRDELARLMGIDDGDHRIAWLYRQERGPYGVKVSIQTKARALTVVEAEG